MAHSRFKPLHIAFIIALPVIGFTGMYMFVYILPLSDNVLIQIFYTLVLIALGLAIPYWILKLGIHEAHLANPEEKELELKDVPKDKQQLDEETQSKRHRA